MHRCEQIREEWRHKWADEQRGGEAKLEKEEAQNEKKKEEGKEETTPMLKHIVGQMRDRDLLFSLGFRCTAGSILTVPPKKEELIAAFEQKFKPNVVGCVLTVGARAWTKHAQRSSEEWWGSVEGSEKEKNERALSCIERVLAKAEWMNIHELPHEQPVLEVRMKEGYGARWYIDTPITFRGFLEPQMEGGHEKRWRH
uniref:Uncharacterized protein n=2 Tax=Palpitomonas bilix TaxID=652834 RepID=A0A7S3LVQ2_9EUKA|mmetsp:Transcript_50446/g.129978  ORF Transcript_50446/g.129978 Transcript_50446/m.129978 type:complete len:198 (+) Transcript_50446:192-785(+)